MLKTRKKHFCLKKNTYDKIRNNFKSVIFKRTNYDFHEIIENNSVD